MQNFALKEDINKLSGMNFSSIKQLVTYYQISNISDEKKDNREFVNFSVTFDKDKIHNLFYNRGISYSDISEKELFILPIVIEKMRFLYLITIFIIIIGIKYLKTI